MWRRLRRVRTSLTSSPTSPTVLSSRCGSRDLPTPQVLIDQPRALRNIARVQALATGRGRPASAARQDPQIARSSRGGRSSAARSASAARRSARPRCSPTRASPTSACPIRSIPSNAARLLALMDRATISIIVDHLGRRARLVGRDAARRPHARRAGQGGRRISPLRHRSGRRRRSGSCRRSRRLPGLRLRGLLSHAGHGYHAASEDELARDRGARKRRR